MKKAKWWQLTETSHVLMEEITPNQAKRRALVEQHTPYDAIWFVSTFSDKKIACSHASTKRGAMLLARKMLAEETSQ